MYKRLGKFFINIRLWLIILPPIILWFILFPFKTVNIASTCTNSETPILYSDISKPTLATLIADVLQVPLNLRWYDLHIKYNIRPERGWLMTKPMILMIDFYNPGPLIPANGLKPMSTSSVPNLGPRSYQIPVDKDIVFHYSGNNSLSCRTAATGGEFERDQSVSDKETVNLEMSFAIKPDMIKITAETNVLTWITKLIVLFLLWSGINLLLLGTWKFINAKSV